MATTNDLDVDRLDYLLSTIHALADLIRVAVTDTATGLGDDAIPGGAWQIMELTDEAAAVCGVRRWGKGAVSR